ncbi:MAG: CHASE3 domain sensor protein, partial [Psychromonas sp.]
MKKKLVNLIFGISLGVLFLLCLLTYDRLSTFNKYTNIVDNSHKVLLAISNLRAGFNTSIAEQRTYLITKDTTYYNNFQQKKDSLRHTIQEFKKLTRDSKIHQFYIKKLEIEANNRIQSLLVEILNDTSKAEFKFEQLELIDDNQAINKSYFAILEIINTHENQLLRKRLRIKEFEEQFAPFLKKG